MKKSIFALYRTQIPVALAGFFSTLVYGGNFEAGSFYYAALLFFAVLALYNAHKIIKLQWGHYSTAPNFQQQVWAEKRWSIVLLLFSLCASGYLFLVYFKQWWLFFLLTGFLAIFYLIPLVRFEGRWLALRQITGLKGVVVALTWTVLTGVLPCVISNNRFASTLLVFWTAQFFTFYVIAGLSDVRDLTSDPKNLKTLPQLIGRLPAIYFYQVLLGISLVLIAVSWLQNLASNQQVVALALGLLTLIFLTQKAKTPQPFWFYSILVDGVLIFQALLYLVFVGL